MPGLIPLMLNPVAAGDCSSVVFDPSKPRTRHSRGQSISSPALPIFSPQSPAFPFSTLPASPQPFTSPRLRPTKRFLSAPPSVLPVVPYTSAEWRRAIVEVKRQHTNRRYRACFMRCNEILESTKCLVDTEPVYLISLHFYAATAMEMCARPLSAPSTYRDTLLQQARSHYDQAADLVNDAELSAQRISRGSLAFLSPQSLHSPSGSFSSRAWSSETGVSSPTPSVCSSEDFSTRSRQFHTSPLPAAPPPVPMAARKKVSFELPREDLSRCEPYIRPDSPTLGFDDEYFTTALSRQELPDIPDREKSPDLSHAVHHLEDGDVAPHYTKSFDHLASFSSPVEPALPRSSILLDASASRYCFHLSSLKTQIARHRADLDATIRTPVTDKGQVSGQGSTSFEENAGDLERMARIERLRKNGWQRKRFDPSRYEALRNAALAELN